MKLELWLEYPKLAGLKASRSSNNTMAFLRKPWYKYRRQLFAGLEKKKLSETYDLPEKKN